MSAAFFDRPQKRISTSAGELDVPAFFRDASTASAFFRIDHARAVEALAGTAFAPLRFAGGAAIAAVAAYDYRDTCVGPYRELACAIAGVPRGRPMPRLPMIQLLRANPGGELGWLIIDIPVTTSFADAAGREPWGFPKFVAAIDVAIAEDRLLAAVRAADGEPIVTLEGGPGAGVPLPSRPLVIYTRRGGELLRSLLETRGVMRTSLGRGLTVRVGRGGHPMARRLAALGLDGARPFMAQVCRSYSAILGEGVSVPAGVALAA